MLYEVITQPFRPLVSGGGEDSPRVEHLRILRKLRLEFRTEPFPLLEPPRGNEERELELADIRVSRLFCGNRVEEGEGAFKIPV